VGRRPVKPETAFSFSNLVSRIYKLSQIRILKNKKAFSRFDPKIEVVQNLILYNFALGHILKFQTDFELKIQSPFLIKNLFSRIFLKAKFGEILNTKVVPKIMLNNSRLFKIVAKHVSLT
jgi:hypothetical protein